jgi:ribosomal protein S27AE
MSPPLFPKVIEQGELMGRTLQEAMDKWETVKREKLCSSCGNSFFFALIHKWKCTTCGQATWRNGPQEVPLSLEQIQEKRRNLHGENLPNVELAEAIRGKMNSMKLGMRDLAGMVGVSHTTIWRILQGSPRLNFFTVTKICIVLRLDHEQSPAIQSFISKNGEAI